MKKPYGLWRSPVEISELFSQPAAPMFPFRYQQKLHWLQAITKEGGRIALMRQLNSSPGNSDTPQCLTPAEFNIRTAVHEYGGRCFCVLGEYFIFSNLSDGRIYRQRLSDDSTPTAVTALPTEQQPQQPSPISVYFADLLPLEEHNAVIAVMESNAGDAQHNSLVVIDLTELAEHNAEANLVTPTTLAEGSDFYASPVVSPDQSELAWIEWDNPYMPWDQSRLVKAELNYAEKILIRNQQFIVNKTNQAVCQPGFLADNSLLFVSDEDGGNGDTTPANFWDFFRYRNNQLERITADTYEYGEAHWVFGNRRWQQISENQIIAVASNHEGDALVKLSVDSGIVDPVIDPLADDFAVCAELWMDANTSTTHTDAELLFVARYPKFRAEIVSVDCSPASSSPPKAVSAISTDVDAHGYSEPQPIVYPTRDGQRAYAYYYAPFNRQYHAGDDSKPPVVVVVHGGPSSRATPELNPLKQFFTSLGYAVLDVNHRGSTGYGRAYRQSLLGQWGEIDATDIADGVKYLIEQELVNPELVFIRGGSAGGYAVLRALTRFPQMFSGGACYYGIGNLITLAKITHKFEGCYTNRLIGEKFTENSEHPDSRFVQRSPIFQMDQLRSPLILFQGLDDKVVPPAVSREVAALLKEKGIPHDYIEYENEGHGFRQLATRIDSLKRETEFFADIIRKKAAASAANIN